MRLACSTVRSLPFTFHRTSRISDKVPIKSINCTAKFSTNYAWDVNTNVVKDLVIYSHDNEKFHKFLNVFAVAQLVFWLFTATASMSMRDTPVKEDIDKEKLRWYQTVNLGEKKFRNGITAMYIGVGVSILCGSWMYSLRSVNNIILRKGGKNIILTTYSPFLKLRSLDVPLANMSAIQLRSTTPNQLPVKVKGRKLYFLIDVKGELKNPSLFDATVGLRRILK